MTKKISGFLKREKPIQRTLAGLLVLTLAVPSYGFSGVFDKPPSVDEILQKTYSPSEAYARVVGTKMSQTSDAKAYENRISFVVYAIKHAQQNKIKIDDQFMEKTYREGVEVFKVSKAAFDAHPGVDNSQAWSQIRTGLVTAGGAVAGALAIPSGGGTLALWAAAGFVGGLGALETGIGISGLDSDKINNTNGPSLRSSVGNLRANLTELHEMAAANNDLKKLIKAETGKFISDLAIKDPKKIFDDPVFDGDKNLIKGIIDLKGDSQKLHALAKRHLNSQFKAQKVAFDEMRKNIESMDSRLGKVESKVDDLKKDVDQLVAAQKNEEAQKFKQLNFETKVDASRVWSSNLETLGVMLKDKNLVQAAKLMSVATNLIVAIEKYNSNKSADGAMALLSGNYLAAGLAIVQMFGPSQPNPDAMILEGIQAIQKQLQALHENMNAQFKALNEQLVAQHKEVMNALDAIVRNQMVAETILDDLRIIGESSLRRLDLKERDQKDQLFDSYLNNCVNSRILMASTARACLEKIAMLAFVIPMRTSYFSGTELTSQKWLVNNVPGAAYINHLGSVVKNSDLFVNYATSPTLSRIGLEQVLSQIDTQSGQLAIPDTREWYTYTLHLIRLIQKYRSQLDSSEVNRYLKGAAQLALRIQDFHAKPGVVNKQEAGAKPQLDKAFMAKLIYEDTKLLKDLAQGMEAEMNRALKDAFLWPVKDPKTQKIEENWSEAQKKAYTDYSIVTAPKPEDDVQIFPCDNKTNLVADPKDVPLGKEYLVFPFDQSEEAKKLKKPISKMKLKVKDLEQLNLPAELKQAVLLGRLIKGDRVRAEVCMDRIELSGIDIKTTQKLVSPPRFVSGPRRGTELDDSHPAIYKDVNHYFWEGRVDLEVRYVELDKYQLDQLPLKKILVARRGVPFSWEGSAPGTHNFNFIETAWNAGALPKLREGKEIQSLVGPELRTRVVAKGPERNIVVIGYNGVDLAPIRKILSEDKAQALSAIRSQFERGYEAKIIEFRKTRGALNYVLSTSLKDVKLGTRALKSILFKHDGLLSMTDIESLIWNQHKNSAAVAKILDENQRNLNSQLNFYPEIEVPLKEDPYVAQIYLDAVALQKVN